MCIFQECIIYCFGQLGPSFLLLFKGISFPEHQDQKSDAPSIVKNISYNRLPPLTYYIQFHFTQPNLPLNTHYPHLNRMKELENF